MSMIRWFGIVAMGLVVPCAAGCGSTGPANPGPDIIVSDEAPQTSEEAAGDFEDDPGSL